MKTDTQLQKDVMDEIEWEPSTTAAQIGVSAENGVVTLSGTVATHAAKWAVVRAAQRVQGVKGIAEEITVNRHGRLERPGRQHRAERHHGHVCVTAAFCIP